jgi:NDP-sugar pyrophosphorylase family protein
MIPALVLTAGLATRLRPLSFVRAKAALPVAGEPLIRRILRSLAGAGVTDAVVNLHHLPHTLTRVVGDGSELGVRVRYSWETPVLGSAGGPRHALPLLGASRFLIVNGDTLTDANVQALMAEHRRSGALVTMAVVPNTEPDRYGGAVVDPSGIITGFTRRGSAESSYHVIGLQVAEAEAFASLPDNTPCESTRSLYPALIRAIPGSVRAWRTSADFLDIGTPADYLATALSVAARQGLRQNPSGLRVRIDATAQVVDSVLWDDVAVEAGALLRECVVTDGVRVPADTSWTGVTIRNANGELCDGERVIDGLAIGPI